MRSSSALTIISRLRGQKDEDYIYNKNRSSSLESNSSTHTDSDLNRNVRVGDDIHERRKSSPYILDNSGVIKASLTIPVHTQNQSLAYNIEEDIPFIEDVENGRQQFTVGVIKTPIAPARRRNHSVGSDSSAASNIQPVTGSISVIAGYDSAVGSSVTCSSTVHNTPNSSSAADPGAYSSPPSWASTPPTSPDSTQTSVNYIPDDMQPPKALLRATKCMNIAKEAAPTLQKVSFSSAQEIQQVGDSSKSYQRETSVSKQKTTEQTKTTDVTKTTEREPRFTPSISNIGNDVLRSKTADFERIIKVDTVKPKSPILSSSEREKKKYTKRRYTDSRHQTRHIPDSEALESASAQCKRDEKASSSQSGPVYKRRELISSAPSK